MKAPAQNHPPLSFQNVHDWAQILLLVMSCTIWVLFSMVLQFLLLILSSMQGLLTWESTTGTDTSLSFQLFPLSG